MPQVQTSHGTVEGAEHNCHLSFLGIPFAASTAGAARWQPPTPPAPWPGVRPSAPGLAAPQSGHPVPGFAASGPQGEDCLSLNVFTPATTGARRPVLVWIHGGGFTHGASTEALYNGGPLAHRGDAVVVTINYRLGALGYLYLGEHLPGRGLTANAGQLDQIAALQWVQQNIAAFGGDPGNVTIFGESAGAMAVATLLAMPAASGLFHRAIMQSGNARCGDRETAVRTADLLLAELGIDRANAARLLELPAEKIVAAQSAVSSKNARFGNLLFGPIVDGETLPRPTAEAISAGSAASIPLLIGTNRDEIKLFAASVVRDPITDDQLDAAVRTALRLPETADVDPLVHTYRHSRTAHGLPADNLDILDSVTSDNGFRVPSLRLAIAQRQHQPDTYAYLFTYASPARRGALGACHALEMPFVFGTLSAPGQDRFAGTGPDVERLSTDMMDAWLAFARTGRPAHAGIGAWVGYDPETRPTMVFDRTSREAFDPHGEERKAIEPFIP